MKLELKVRRLNKWGRVSSPTSTFGYVFQVAFVLAVAGLLTVGHFRSRHGADLRPLVFAMVFVPFLFIHVRDLMAWLLATDSEREQFRHEVKTASQLDRSRLSSPSTPMDSRLVLLVATVMFGFMATALSERPPLVAIPVLGWLYVAIRVASERRRERRST